jgi:hypothetical protein
VLVLKARQYHRCLPGTHMHVESTVRYLADRMGRDVTIGLPGQALMGWSLRARLEPVTSEGSGS